MCLWNIGCLKFEQAEHYALALSSPAGFKQAQPVGDWTCTSCGASNFARRGACFKCDAPRQDSACLTLWTLWHCLCDSEEVTDQPVKMLEADGVCCSLVNSRAIAGPKQPKSLEALEGSLDLHAATGAPISQVQQCSATFRAFLCQPKGPHADC